MVEANPVVREMTKADGPAVAGILKAAFQRDDEARLLDILDRSGDLAAALVAELEGKVAGVAVLSRLRAPEAALGLGPIAVSDAARHMGVGAALIEAAIAWGVDNHASGLFVLGRPRYYTRFGFSVERAAGFEHSWPSEFMLAREIGESRLPEGGELSYPPAFAALG